MLQRLWSCCCCPGPAPGSGSAGEYSPVHNTTRRSARSPSARAAEASASARAVADKVRLGLLAGGPDGERMRDADSAGSGAFEIEIDEAEDDDLLGAGGTTADEALSPSAQRELEEQLKALSPSPSAPDSTRARAEADVELELARYLADSTRHMAPLMPTPAAATSAKHSATASPRSPTAAAAPPRSPAAETKGSWPAQPAHAPAAAAAAIRAASPSIASAAASRRPGGTPAGSRSPIAPLQPPPGYEFPAPVAAVAAAPAAVSPRRPSRAAATPPPQSPDSVTAKDLEVNEADADILAFRRALDHAESRIAREDAAALSVAATAAAAPVPAAAARAVSPALFISPPPGDSAPSVLPASAPAAAPAPSAQPARPGPVQLPRNANGVAPPSTAVLGSGSSSARSATIAPTFLPRTNPLTPGPGSVVASSAMPIVVRKSPSAAANGREKSLQPSKQQQQKHQQQSIAVPHAAPHLIHSPSAPALSNMPLVIPPPALVVPESPPAAAAASSATAAVANGVHVAAHPPLSALHPSELHPRPIPSPPLSHPHPLMAPPAAAVSPIKPRSPVIAPTVSAVPPRSPVAPPVAVAVTSTVTPAAVAATAPRSPKSSKPPAAVAAPSNGSVRPAAASTAAATSASAAVPVLNPLDRLGVPSGVISSVHMDSIMSTLKSAPTGASGLADVSYAHLFAFLASASRTLPGPVIKPFVMPELQAIVEAHQTKPGHLKRSVSMMAAPSAAAAGAGADAKPAASSSGMGLEAAKLLLSFLHWLVDIRVDRVARTLSIRFDFGTAASGAYTYIDVPSQPTWVLASRHPTDPFLFHPLNQPKLYRNESHRLCIHKELLFQFDRTGLLSLRSGDVSIKKFVSFNCDMRTEYRPGMVEYDDKRNAFIAMDAHDDTKPIIVGGHYVPRTFDYWLVCSVLKQESWIGLPVIGQPAKANLNMKPHAGYAYP